MTISSNTVFFRNDLKSPFSKHLSKDLEALIQLPSLDYLPKEKGKRKRCLYDGVTILIKDPASIAYIKSEPGLFKLKGSYDMATGEIADQFEGKYRNFDIWTGGNRRGAGVFVGGSFHKWKNVSHNYDAFFWDEFVKVYTEIAEAFHFRPELADICSVEAGVNIDFNKDWVYKAADIPKSVVLFKMLPGQA